MTRPPPRGARSRPDRRDGGRAGRARARAGPSHRRASHRRRRVRRWPGFAVRLEFVAGAPGEDPLPTVVRNGPRRAVLGRPVPPGGYRLTAARAGLRAAARAADRGRGGAAARAGDGGPRARARRAASAGGFVDGARGAAAGARVRCVASAIEDLTVQTGASAAGRRGRGAAVGRGPRARHHADHASPTRRPVHRRRPHPRPLPRRGRAGGAEPFRSDELRAGARRAPRPRRRSPLRPGFPVAGRVVDESGAPDRRRPRASSRAAHPAASAGLVAVTDGGGASRSRCRRGATGWRPRAPGRGARGGRRRRRGGSSPPALELRLVRAEAPLEGLVRDDGGRPLARARLAVWPAVAGPGASPGATPSPAASPTSAAISR